MNDIDPNTPEILFMTALRSMLKSVGIDKIHEAMDYFKLMEESVGREIFYRQNPNNGNRYKEHRGRQNYIAIFKNRYKLSYDIEYETPVSEKEAHVIGLLLKKLEDKKIPIDFYLEWYFEDYLPKSKKTAESIMWSCSAWVYQSFLLNNRDKMQDLEKQQLEEKEKIEIFEKAKELLRNAKAIGHTDLAESLVSVLKEYNNSTIDLDHLRETVKAMTDINKAFKDKKIKETT